MVLKLSTELNDFRIQNHVLRSNCATLESSLDLRIRETASVKKISQVGMQELEQKLKKANDENQELRSMAEANLEQMLCKIETRDTKQVEEQLEKLTARAHALELQNKDLAAASEAKEGDLKRMTQRAKDLEIHNKKLVNQSKTSASEASRRLQDLETLYMAQLRQNEELKTRPAKSETELQNLQKDKAELETELQKLRKHNTELVSFIKICEQKQARLTQLEDENKILRSVKRGVEYAQYLRELEKHRAKKSESEPFSHPPSQTEPSGPTEQEMNFLLRVLLTK
jgi:chromosome segregation ATPase